MRRRGTGDPPAGREPSGRVAALDLGEAYTGVALSDSGRTLATPLEVVPSAGLEEYLSDLVGREGVGEVVVGVPRTMGGEVGFQARRIFGTLSHLRERMPEVEFVEWDERLTTRIAAPPASGRRGKKRRERVDHLAAAHMLQEYLRYRESV